jgi:dTMP kinase
MRGRFITFEGGEGSGKSTQATLLVRRLKSLALAALLTREPGGSAGAEVMRYILLSGAAKPLGPETETVLFAAARDDHVNTTIRPALERGTWVVCDRFMDSTRVYQGALGQVDPRIIRGLERVTIADVMPDLTFILDVPAEVGLERAAKRRAGERPDRFEQETIAFHTKLREAYREIAASEPTRCVLVDARQPQSAVAEDIWRAVTERLSPVTAPLARVDVGS